MPLDELRARISALSQPTQLASPRSAVPALILAPRSLIDGVKPWFDRWMGPHHEWAKQFIVWADSATARDADLAAAVDTLLDVNLQKRALTQGLNVLSAASQVIVLEDLACSGAAERRGTCASVLGSDGRLRDLGWRIGLLLRAEAGQEVEVRSDPDPLSAHLDRLFLVDRRSIRHTRMTTDQDVYSFLAQALVWIVTRPIAMQGVSSGQSFAEWVGRRPGDEGASALGGVTLVFPIEAHLETLAVRAAGPVLEEVLAGEVEEARPTGEAQRWINACALNTREGLIAALNRMAGTHKVAPLSRDDSDHGLPRWDARRPARFVDGFSAVDARLADLARWAGERLREAGRIMGTDLSYRLIEEANRTVHGGPAGLRAASLAARRAARHTQSLAQDSVPDAPPKADPAERLRAMSEHLRRSPAPGALPLRGLLLFIVGLLGTWSTWQPLGWWSVCFGGVGLAGALAALVHDTACRERVDKLRGEAIAALSTRWKRLLAAESDQAVDDLLLCVRGCLDTLEGRLDRALHRVDDLVRTCTEHRASPPVDTAFWISIPVGPEQLRLEVESLAIDAGALARDWRAHDLIPVLWERLGRPGKAELDALEWRLVERTALYGLPACNPIAARPLPERLRADHRLFAIAARHLEDAATDLFIRLEPGYPPPSATMTLEVPPGDHETFVDDLLREAHIDATRTGLESGVTPHRIMLVSHADGVAMKSPRPDPIQAGAP